MNCHSQEVALASTGDREAYGRLAEAAWPSLVGLARTVLAEHALAEDAVQDSLLIGWQRLPQLEQIEAFEAWLRRIVYRRCLRILEERKRRSQARTQDSTVLNGSPPGDVERLLVSLSPKQRAVVYLGDIQGHSDREVASILGTSLPTIRVHRLRARRKLRKLYGGPPS